MSDPTPPEPAEDPQTSPAEPTPEPGQLPSEIDTGVGDERSSETGTGADSEVEGEVDTPLGAEQWDSE